MKSILMKSTLASALFLGACAGRTTPVLTAEHVQKNVLQAKDNDEVKMFTLYREDFRADIVALLQKNTLQNECREPQKFSYRYVEDGRPFVDKKTSCFDNLELDAMTKQMVVQQLPIVMQKIFSIFSNYQQKHTKKQIAESTDSYKLLLEEIANILRPIITTVADQNPSFASMLPDKISNENIIDTFQNILIHVGYIWKTEHFTGIDFPHVNKIIKEDERNITYMSTVYSELTNRGDLFHTQSIMSKMIYYKPDPTIFPEQKTTVHGYVSLLQPSIVYIRDTEGLGRDDIPMTMMNDVIEEHERAHSYFNRIVPYTLFDVMKAKKEYPALYTEYVSINELLATCASVHGKSLDHMLFTFLFIDDKSVTYKYIRQYLFEAYVEEFMKRAVDVPAVKNYSREQLVDFLRHENLSDVKKIHQQLFTLDDTASFFTRAAQLGINHLEQILEKISVEQQIAEQKAKLLVEGYVITEKDTRSIH